MSIFCLNLFSTFNNYKVISIVSPVMPLGFALSFFRSSAKSK